MRVLLISLLFISLVVCFPKKEDESVQTRKITKQLRHKNASGRNMTAHSSPMSITKGATMNIVKPMRPRKQKQPKVKKNKDEVSQIFEYILMHPNECGDPFRNDSKWIPAHSACNIPCDIHKNLCMVDLDGKTQMCEKLKPNCVAGIDSMKKV